MSGTRFRLADTNTAHLAAARVFKDRPEAFGPRVPSGSDIRHIGATSIPGALTKGDLAIAARVGPADLAVAQALLDKSDAQNLKSVRGCLLCL